ncbi:hypothetical protein SLEP1_g47703 [Rubroshorea leprosula]|uniref:Uncharacterized protein n=1 Tax=Rubroshorea leprosula TaxID=152421 RepID=A0AAV5LS81_9ROSI|nr:hypothetical protein SLEP1_g47703 [Rubroshorea leprosula]
MAGNGCGGLVGAEEGNNNGVTISTLITFDAIAAEEVQNMQ